MREQSALVWVNIVMVCGSVVVLDAQPIVRSIPYQFDVPVSSRLLPDDEIVFVGQVFDTASAGPEISANDIIDGATVEADLVLVANLFKATGTLVNRGTWINTKLDGVVRDVIRSRNQRQFSKGRAIQVFINGGELRIGPVLIRAGNSETQFVPIVPVPRLYLLFLRNYSGLLRPTYVPMIVESGKLKYPWAPTTHPSSTALHDLPLENVADRGRKVKNF